MGGTFTGYWDDRVEKTLNAGSLTSKTWRAYAGIISKYRQVTVPGNKAGYRWVVGTHIEKLPSNTRIATFHTDAVNCNITKW